MELIGKNILIVGGGRAGERAFKYGKKKNYQIFVIDPSINCKLRNFVDVVIEKDELAIIEELVSPNISILVEGDIEIAFLLLQKFKFEYIFPTVPRHLAAELAIFHLKKLHQKAKPDSEMLKKVIEKIPSDLILSYDLREGIMILSYMPIGSNCKADCSAPDICPVTGIEKSTPLFEIINLVIHQLNGIVLESIQMKPGLGAITSSSLNDLFKFVKNKNRVIISTSSRCHGVLNALQVF